MSAARWGILGGIFDPIHYGHLAIAEQTRERLELSAVVFVPAGRPVHRAAPAAEAADRVRMVEMAIADNAAFEYSRIEVDAERPSYTLDTLEAMAVQEPGRELVLIASAEAVALMPSWRRPQRLLELAQVAVVPRPGYPDIGQDWLAEQFPGQAERFTFVATTPLGHSSSDIRARVAAGRSIRYLVPISVERYIGEHGLYGSHDRQAA